MRSPHSSQDQPRVPPHRPARDPVRVAVERPAPGLGVVRVAGSLTEPGLARVLRTLDALLHPADGRQPLRHVVVDLEGVGEYGLGGLEPLCSPSPATTLHLSGLGSREEQLPRGVVAQLAAFSRFDTVENACAQLLPDCTGPVADPEPDERGPHLRVAV